MRLYYGIDGTDNDDDTPVYSGPVPSPKIFQSYVRRIKYISGFHGPHNYEPGPTQSLTGHSTGRLAKNAAEWVERQVKLAKGKPPKVYLGGFSRGAAAAINAAYHLNKSGIAVDALFLFDAVDRTYSIPFWTVWETPKNVRVAFHAVRASSAASRPGFSNIILRNRCIARSFHTSHGGIGGWPLDHFETVKERSAENTHKTSTPGSILPSGRLVATEKIFPGVRRKTKVSPLEQLSGSLAVWNWMSGCVLSTLNHS